MVIFLENENDSLFHIGVKRRSGRYEWGSGEDPYQHEDFYGRYNDLRSKGLTEKEIADFMGITTTKLRARRTIAYNEQLAQRQHRAYELKQKGYSNTKIGEIMGVNESTVRSLLNPSSRARANASTIIANNLNEARVFVHRDFMPRNLMVSDPMPGVLDFQDALMGPVSYDIASLMRDAFISWGETFVLDTTIRYWDKARKAGIPVPQDFGIFWRDVEWMGMQRHLKVLGIFARINYRDGKPKYLADTPRFIGYVRQCANRYAELKPINWLLDCFEEEKTKEAYF